MEQAQLFDEEIYEAVSQKSVVTEDYDLDLKRLLAQSNCFLCQRHIDKMAPFVCFRACEIVYYCYNNCAHFECVDSVHYCAKDVQHCIQHIPITEYGRRTVNAADSLRLKTPERRRGDMPKELKTLLMLVAECMDETYIVEMGSKRDVVPETVRLATLLLKRGLKHATNDTFGKLCRFMDGITMHQARVTINRLDIAGLYISEAQQFFAPKFSDLGMIPADHCEDLIKGTTLEQMRIIRILEIWRHRMHDVVATYKLTPEMIRAEGLTTAHLRIANLNYTHLRIIGFTMSDIISMGGRFVDCIKGFRITVSIAVEVFGMTKAHLSQLAGAVPDTWLKNDIDRYVTK